MFCLFRECELREIYFARMNPSVFHPSVFVPFWCFLELFPFNTPQSLWLGTLLRHQCRFRYFAITEVPKTDAVASTVLRSVLRTSTKCTYNTSLILNSSPEFASLFLLLTFFLFLLLRRKCRGCLCFHMLPPHSLNQSLHRSPIIYCSIYTRGF
jgi:hypothetical protein